VHGWLLSLFMPGWDNISANTTAIKAAMQQGLAAVAGQVPIAQIQSDVDAWFANVQNDVDSLINTFQSLAFGAADREAHARRRDELGGCAQRRREHRRLSSVATCSTT